MSAKVSIVKCDSYEPALVQERTRRAIDLLGGISVFIRPKARVLVKPNLLMASAPEAGIVTHPEVVRAIVKVLKGIDCRILIGDGPSVWGKQAEHVHEVYRTTGIEAVAKEEDVELVVLEQKRWHKNFPLTTWIDKCDFVVNLPKFKTHEFTLLTGAVKNLFGLVSGTFKTELHKNYFKPEAFAGILADILEEVKPAITVVDAVTSMEGDGPATKGILRQDNLLFASSDCVAMDSVLALVMGIKPFDVLSTKIAANRGLGVGDISRIEVVGEKLDQLRVRPFVLPSTSFRKKLPPGIINIAKSLIKYYPCVEADNCVACATCVAACPNKVISMKNNLPVFNYKKCIACFCCQEGCPAAAIKVKKSLFAKIIGL